ncbi:DUF2848 domain-containing protein [Chelativorans salis]|uniref:DUF2848 domain-containing protein n=1 Tax=Chelativorans salis TaxID=2978478 RepID=A0ABT2LU05_9HYPH|nr:DUF2848 domain-containing protein [Chelativorans sp. EGI FJ00035]MCT7378007.1 DUF2848 domain-containing protein [Chelativorans sp. EGI FJ00035]
MRFTCAESTLDLDFAHCVVAGWTGRNPDAIQHHIDELAAIGVAPPSTVPLYYRVSAGLLTQARSLQFVGENTSGEVEPLVVRAGGKTYLGLASDHTDRELEAHSVALSKQVCAKPCASELWDFEEVADRLDALELRSWIKENGDWVLYQEGTLSAMRPMAELMEGAALEALSGKGPAAMLGGTLGVTSGGVRPASEFRMEMRDPETGRTITHGYSIKTLPAVA